MKKRIISFVLLLTVAPMAFAGNTGRPDQDDIQDNNRDNRLRLTRTIERPRTQNRSTGSIILGRIVPLGTAARVAPQPGTAPVNSNLVWSVNNSHLNFINRRINEIARRTETGNQHVVESEMPNDLGIQRPDHMLTQLTGIAQRLQQPANQAERPALERQNAVHIYDRGETREELDARYARIQRERREREREERGFRRLPGSPE